MKRIFLVWGMLVFAKMGIAQGLADSSAPNASGCSRIAAPLLTSVPPLHTDMSWKTLLGYVWLDSVMRHHYTTSEWAALDSIRSKDSINQVLKYLYAVSDYDPLLFRQYTQDAQKLNISYTGPPAPFVFYLETKASNIYGDTSKIPYLLGASYILHIRVMKVTPSQDTLEQQGGYPLLKYCIQALVIDTIKGKHIPLGTCDTLLLLQGNKGKQIAQTANCLHFFYCPGWMKNRSDQSGLLLYKGDGTPVFRNGAMGTSLFSEGQDYIVFFDAEYEDHDSHSSYFELAPILDGNGGVYPIIDGSVSDPINRWGWGSTVALNTFTMKLRGRIDNILNP